MTFPFRNAVMDRARRAALALAALLALGATGCGAGRSGQEAPDAARPSFLLVSIDTLRADHLGCYGYPRATSPAIDRLAQGSLRFETAYAPAPSTLPSHAGMLTGVHPYDLGIVSREGRIPDGAPRLAHLLNEAGYQTGAFVDSSRQGFVGAERGFAVGFETYVHSTETPAAARREHEHDARATADAALAWLAARQRDRPFFLFVHTKSVHTVPAPESARHERGFPYDQPPPYRFRFLPERAAGFTWRGPGGVGAGFLAEVNQRIRRGAQAPEAFPERALDELAALYDAGIVFVDDQVGRLLEGLDRDGSAAETVVVVTSDHGEAFLDHRQFLHEEVYEPLIRVPLIVRLPGQVAGRSVPGPVELMDLVPTLAGLAGLEPPEGLDGVPLPLAEGPAAAGGARPLFAHYQKGSGRGRYQAFSLREGPWKLVVHNLGSEKLRQELYHLGRDPGERHPVTGEERIRRRLARALRTRLEAEPRFGAATVELSDETIERLRSLGYVE
jgi:arylsulfatase A-like enzyme